MRFSGVEFIEMRTPMFFEEMMVMPQFFDTVIFYVFFSDQLISRRCSNCTTWMRNNFINCRILRWRVSLPKMAKCRWESSWWSVELFIVFVQSRKFRMPNVPKNYRRSILQSYNEQDFGFLSASPSSEIFPLSFETVVKTEK